MVVTIDGAKYFMLARAPHNPRMSRTSLMPAQRSVSRPPARQARRSTRPWRTLLAGALLLPLAAGAHDYRIEIDAAISHMRVEARFSEPVDTVTAKSNDAGDFLIDARDCGNGNPIRLRNRRMMLPVDGVTCMNYTVDLERAARHEPQNRSLSAGNRLISPSLWLWRPRLTNGVELDLSFDLPPGMQVSLPWPRRPGETHAYRLGRSPESSHAPALFGRFETTTVEVPGATISVNLLQSNAAVESRVTADAIAEWIRATATDVSLAYGRFPNPSPQVVVIPVGDSRRGAVSHGRVIRDGGEAIELYIDERQPLDAFLRDWTATHEFSHLMLPYVERGQRWVSEGFAQYYQNVLMARSGAYDRQRAWQELYEGFERGRQSRPELSPNDAAAGSHREARMKIYWSGAALALMADVELRERSGGSETLDDVMARLQACCLPSDRVWSGPELFATLDSLATYPVFMPLYRRYADTAGFPDIRPLFERLGLSVAHDEVRIRKNGELAHIRAAITAVDPSTARWREQLARATPRRQAGAGGSR